MLWAEWAIPDIIPSNKRCIIQLKIKPPPGGGVRSSLSFILGAGAERQGSRTSNDPSHPLKLFDSRRLMPAVGGL